MKFHHQQPSMKKQKSKKYQSVITARIWQSMRKATAAFLVLFVFVGVVQIDGTNAGFSDIETSTDNIFTAASLDGRISYLERFSVTGMAPEDSPSQKMTLKNEGSLDFQYEMKYQKTSGDDVLCGALLLTAKNGVTTVYDKLPLQDFDTTTIAGNPYSISVFGQDKWTFSLELPSDAGSTLENKNCSWNFAIHAWQMNLPDDGTGFVDVETAGIHSVSTGEWLTPGDVVINEVMWMGSTASSADEWIELKNMTGNAVPLGGWKLEKTSAGGGTITIPAGKSIPAHGYFLIANYGKSHVNSALNIEGDYIVNLSLNNTNNGTIVLKTGEDVVVDSALATTTWPAGNNGTLKQSMERNDIPGDGLLVTSWHACVSGAANGAPYWDAAGNNFGTPKAANLSPIVLNEFVLNPIGDDGANRPDGEWIELYNILDEDIDVAGWYVKNSADETVMISADNTASGETIVPGNGRLVVYLERAFLDNDADTLSLYTPMGTPFDTTDDVREDTFSYTDGSALPEGKSYARFPDGEGIWIDPVATPGEENEMEIAEKQHLQLLAFETCFDNEKLKKDNQEAICSPLFLTYIGLLKKVDGTQTDDAVILDILVMIENRETKKLADLIGNGVEETLPVTTEEVSSEPVSGVVPDAPPVVPETPVAPPTEDTPIIEPTPVVVEEMPTPVVATPSVEEAPIPEAKEETTPEAAPEPTSAPSN